MTDRPNISLADLSPTVIAQLFILKLTCGSRMDTPDGDTPCPSVVLRSEPLSKERSTRGKDGFRNIKAAYQYVPRNAGRTPGPDPVPSHDYTSHDYRSGRSVGNGIKVFEKD